MTTPFPVTKGQVIEAGEGNTFTARRDGLAVWDGDVPRMLPDPDVVQSAHLPRMRDIDSVTIDGVTYTGAELRTIIAIARREGVE